MPPSRRSNEAQDQDETPMSESDPPGTPGASTVSERTRPRERPSAGAVARSKPARLALKIATFAVALFLFVLAIQLMKEGAKALAPTLSDSPLFSNAISTLGAGWLGAYIVLSGSPIAAVALSLYAGGATTQLQTFTM